MDYYDIKLFNLLIKLLAIDVIIDHAPNTLKAGVLSKTLSLVKILEHLAITEFK